MQSGWNHKLTSKKCQWVKTKIKKEKKKRDTCVQYCNHANNIRTVNSHQLMRVTEAEKSPHLPIPAHPLSAKGGNRESYNSESHQ